MGMKTYIAGSSPRFVLPSHLGSPTILNILDEIGEVVISGIPAGLYIPSGLYYADLYTHNRMYPGEYQARWEPVTPSGVQPFGIMSPLGNVVNRKASVDVGSPTTYKALSSMMYDPRPAYRMSPRFIQKYAPFADYWLLHPNDVYSGLTETYDYVKQYNPDCKVGAVLQNTVESKWPEHMKGANTDGIGYVGYPLTSGIAASSSYWTNLWDNIITNTDLDFYVVSGLEDNSFRDWVLSNDKEIIVKTNVPLFDYQSIIYNTHGRGEASKIMASGVYPWTNDYRTAGRVGCGFFGYVGNQGDLVTKNNYETRYEKLTFINSGITAYQSAVEGADMSDFKHPTTYSHIWTEGSFLTGALTMSGLIEDGKVREVDYFGLSGDMLWDPRTESGLTYRLKRQWPNMIISAYVPRYMVAYNGDGQPADSFTREVYEAFLDDQIEIEGTTHRFVQWSHSGLVLSRHSTVQTPPTGLGLKWIRTEKTTGNTYSGLCNAYVNPISGQRDQGTVYAISGLGYDLFNNFAMPAMDLSTDNHIIFEWAGAAQFRFWEHRWRKQHLDICKKWAENRFGSNKVDGFFIDHSSQPASHFTRNNPAGFVPDQTVDDNAYYIPGETGSNPWWVYEWKGYYDLNGNYDPNDLDNTVMHGSYSTSASWQNDGDPDDLAIWKALVKKDTNLWIASGLEHDLLNGGYVWNDYNDFLSNKMPFMYQEFTFDTNISAGDVWDRVQDTNFRVRGNSIVLGTHISLSSTITSRRVAYAAGLLCDQVAQPIYHPDVYFGTADSSVWVKPEIGLPINEAYKVGSTICRDFTNGRVELDDTGILQSSSSATYYNKIRIWVNNQPFIIN